MWVRWSGCLIQNRFWDSRKCAPSSSPATLRYPKIFIFSRWQNFGNLEKSDLWFILVHRCNRALYRSQILDIYSRRQSIYKNDILDISLKKNVSRPLRVTKGQTWRRKVKIFIFISTCTTLLKSSISEISVFIQYWVKIWRLG